jgi:hypothetical protein
MYVRMHACILITNKTKYNCTVYCNAMQVSKALEAADDEQRGALVAAIRGSLDSLQHKRLRNKWEKISCMVGLYDAHRCCAWWGTGGAGGVNRVTFCRDKIKLGVVDGWMEDGWRVQGHARPCLCRVSQLWMYSSRDWE